MIIDPGLFVPKNILKALFMKLIAVDSSFA